MNQGSSHVYSEVFLHVNWHCKRSRPQISSQVELPLHAFIENYCEEVKGIHFLRVGGTETHVHLVFQMEPFVQPSAFIGKVKGASAHEMNKEFGGGTLQWQRGYGLVSFAKLHLPWVLRYVENQKEHHRLGTIRHALEAHGEEEGEEKEEKVEGEYGDEKCIYKYANDESDEDEFSSSEVDTASTGETISSASVVA